MFLWQDEVAEWLVAQFICIPSSTKRYDGIVTIKYADDQQLSVTPL